MIEAALAKARENELTRIEIDVRADNRHAIALYERVGFVAEGEVRDAARVDGTYCDALSMAMMLRDQDLTGVS